MRGSSACRPRPTRAKTSKSLSGTSANRSLLTGALLGVATFAVYMIGSNRSFGYDAAATFANFIATPSLWDAFAVRSVIPTLPWTLLAGPRTRWRLVGYAVVMGLALAAHLFAAVVLLCHLTWILTRRSRAQLVELAPAWIGAALIGLAANASVLVTELVRHGLPPPL